MSTRAKDVALVLTALLTTVLLGPRLHRGEPPHLPIGTRAFWYRAMSSSVALPLGMVVLRGTQFQRPLCIDSASLGSQSHPSWLLC